MQRFLKATIAVSIAVLIGVGSFAGGAMYERLRTPPALAASAAKAGVTPVPSGKLPALVKEVEDIIVRDALKPSSEDSMTTNAIDGLLNSLGDTYAMYFDPKANTELRMDSKGEFFGVGMTVGLRETTPTIITVFKGSPAEKAGLKAGDQIVAVDGVSKKKWDLDDVVGRIRGPIDTKVTIRVAREGSAKPLTFTITRARISIPNIMSDMVGTDVGHIRLMQFNDKSAEDIGKAMVELQGKGAKGFILDLRENPGGLLSAAVQVSSLYIDSGVIVRIDQRGKPEERQMAVGGTATDKPLVVLVDNNSASASEIVAGALQDYGRAVIVGEKSYGKGSVQTIRDLSNGGAVKLTTAHYLTPKSRVINGKGVTPDVVVKMDPKLQSKPATDTQLSRAVAILRGKF